MAHKAVITTTLKQQICSAHNTRVQQTSNTDQLSDFITYLVLEWKQFAVGNVLAAEKISTFSKATITAMMSSQHEIIGLHAKK